MITVDHQWLISKSADLNVKYNRKTSVSHIFSTIWLSTWFLRENPSHLLVSSLGSLGQSQLYVLTFYNFEQVKVMEKIYTMVKSKQRNGGGRTASIKNTVELNTSSNNQTQQNQVGNGCCPTWKWNQKMLLNFLLSLY